MVWNTVLALVPLGLAFVLFRRGARTGTVTWWAGVALFVVMLPNAPYVLTDVVHLVDSARHGVTITTLLLYCAFVSVGMLAYTASIARCSAHLRRTGVPLVTAVLAEGGLHALVAVGVLMGRYGRWNSWDLGLRPFHVLTDTLGYANLRGAAAVVLLAAGIAVISALLRLAAYGAADLVRSDA